MIGHGVPTGAAPQSPGWIALGYLMLACDECGATWAGPVGEVCAWCQDRDLQLVAEQAILDARRSRATATMPGWVWCRTCRRAWKGTARVVCGANDPRHPDGMGPCNGWAEALPMAEVPSLMGAE